MQLSVATNWNYDLLELLQGYPVHDLFGSLAMNVVGSGRPPFVLRPISMDTAKDYIEQAHLNGFKFTYLLNAPCLGNIEYDPQVHQGLLDHLAWLSDIRVDYVTISIPYLLELIKTQFPNIKVKVSVIAHVNSVQRALFYESLGADIIALDYMLNRDFALLEKIRKAAKCALELLVNDVCLYQCPFRYYHYNLCGHSSQSVNPMKGFYLDYCIIRCSLEKYSNPSELMKARWIRPEDLHFYEDLGIDYFKVGGRRMSTKWLVNATKAYSSRQYKGNLWDILDSGVIGLDENLESPQFVDYLFKPELSLDKEKLSRFGQLGVAKPYIDNNSLEGFIDFFKRQDCISSCANCDYCQNWAEKAVEFDQSKKDEYLNVLKVLYRELVSSSLFTKQDKKESEANIRWNPTIERQFAEVIKGIPQELRPIAGTMIKKKAESNAQDRGAKIVEEEDLVKAFLAQTPAVFQQSMTAALTHLGIEVKRYQ